MWLMIAMLDSFVKDLPEEFIQLLIEWAVCLFASQFPLLSLQFWRHSSLKKLTGCLPRILFKKTDKSAIA